MSRRAALDAAMEEADPASLAVGERLRRRFEPADVAWALTQASLRTKAARKFARAAEMLFTADGLEQATREHVSRWRAERFAASGVAEVWDLGCGIGADAMAFAEAGLRVVAVELDPDTAEVARHNLSLVGGGEVVVGRAEDADPPPGAAIFLDPARRTARGRTWRVEDFTPPWEFVLACLASQRFVAVKLGPGVPKEMLPDGVQTCFVSDHGDVVEASLWNRLPPGPRAVLLHPPSSDGVAGVRVPSASRGAGVSVGDELVSRGVSRDELGPTHRRDLPTRPVGRYLHEPDGAVIRAGLLDAIAAHHDLWLLDPHLAYLSSDEPLDTPFATTFEVLENLPYDLKLLRRWVRENAVGTVEIKKRGLDVDPAALRRQLKPKGRNSATLVLARTVDGARALVCRRV